MSNNKLYDWSKDIIIPVLTLIAASIFAFYANQISSDSTKIAQNSDVFRYYIKHGEEAGFSIKVKTTSGILRKIAYIKLSADEKIDIQVEDGSFAEEQTDKKIEVESNNLDGFILDDGNVSYMFVLLEGGDGARHLNMLTFDGDKNLTVYDELSLLDSDNQSGAFQSFRSLLNKLQQDKFIN